MRNILCAVLIFVSGMAMAQYPVIREKCATMHSLNYRKQQNPDLQNRMQFTEIQAENWKNVHSNFHTNRNGVLRIPVVFHVVYSLSDSVNQNIHDSLIYSQLNVLNEDFRRMNADAVNTRAVFDTVAADLGIEFCLASVDPLGNPTNGITRTGTTASHFLTPFNQSVKADASGGKDPWPTDQYLNIWVCDMSFLGQPVVLGYAQFPGDDPTTDGVVIQYQYIGRTNDTATAPSNLGRTTTHEVGHWCGLRHIWGDGDCTMDDFVWDTPDADAQSNFDCNHTINTCDDANNLFWGGFNPPDMVENFMDYSADSCMNMFSKGQRDRIWSFLMTDRAGLFTSNGCGTPGLFAQSEINDVTCLGNCDGEITVTPVNGTAPYQFLWNDPSMQTDSTATGLCYGNYSCRIIDANSDTIYVDVNIANPLSMYHTFDITHATCVGCLNGIIEVNTWGGTPPYSFSIDGGTPQSDSMFVYLDPGTYDITVTDSCGVTVTYPVTVINAAAITEQQYANLLIYPNPADENFTVVFPDNRIKKISLINNLGQSVYSFQSENKSEIISVSNLSKGIYWLQTETDGTLFYQKICKQ
jgi:predicted Zn-dependent protease